MPTIRPTRILAALLLGSACLAASAAPTPAPVRSEILVLLEKIKTSGCQFERNRSWHSGAEAQAHLLRKLDYIENRKETLASAEQFIDVAASQSSLSGRPYRIKCGAAEPERSADWLKRELAALRAGGKHKPAQASRP